jgi:hypothetical protein
MKRLITAKEKLEYHRRAGLTPPKELEIRWRLQAGEIHCDHNWESSRWGVILGVSQCKKCGVTSSVEDFVKAADVV